MSEAVQTAIQNMASVMSADERILAFMQGAKFALEAIKAEQAKQEEAKENA